MPNYRRFRIEGATVFITLVTYHRVPFLIQPEARNLLGQAWRYVSMRHPFVTEAICLLPDHIHMLITLSGHDDDYSIRIREIKRMFTLRFSPFYGEVVPINDSRKCKKEAGIWQRRFWEHIIRDEVDFRNHFDYIHYNPVKHGLVDDPKSWKWSSFHRYSKAGIYDESWKYESKNGNLTCDFGE